MKENRFNYFSAFINFSEKALLAAEMLDNCFKNFNTLNVYEEMDKIHAIEHEADTIKHDVIGHLSREFVPPIEREDIISLVSQFDDVVDCIDEVVRRVGMYKIKRVRPDVLHFTSLLCECCKQLREVSVSFSEFKKSKNILDLMIEVNRLESEADTLHFNAISSLFDGSEEALSAIAWKSIYDTLENCFDSCEHTVEVMESVILKNS